MCFLEYNRKATARRCASKNLGKAPFGSPRNLKLLSTCAVERLSNGYFDIVYSDTSIVSNSKRGPIEYKSLAPDDLDFFVES
mmetsp:Transcript_35514/g.79978  ORF Transcript_35514/g.79978 Transcript_35514/m.79978 type:complete len:82 (+) Transcript_35514:632-877(+)